jgi:hypothetical protein
LFTRSAKAGPPYESKTRRPSTDPSIEFGTRTFATISKSVPSAALIGGVVIQIGGVSITIGASSGLMAVAKIRKLL